MERWSVHEYSIEKLTDCLSELSKAEPDTVRDKLHRRYFEDYLPEIGVKTLVVENDYVDRDFLEDYAAYYVRCFNDYERFCSRIHFFAESFTSRDFEQALEEPSNGFVQTLKQSYRGFVVVKPLPETIVGRTCLSTYGDDDGRRYYPVTKNCRAQLFGIDLEVESLPFQEQDTAVARCATSALWSVFHATANLFQHSIPTPVEITTSATTGAAIRVFPNKGLNAHEVSNAIKSTGLEPHVVAAKNAAVLKRTVYAYLQAGIPSYLSFELIDAEKDNPDVIARHAVAVTGCSIPDRTENSREDFHLRSERIDKLYVHDDGVGPFARMTHDEDPTEWTDTYGDSCREKCWETSWRTPSAPEKVYGGKAWPLQLIVPVYHKIRVPFAKILAIVDQFDRDLDELRKGNMTSLNSRPEWDIFLSNITDFKRDIAEAEQLQPKYRRTVLEESMPRFL